ncbi:MAG: acetolactate synthase large subunit [Bacteroidetes bacterium]|nr:MAG: acetolactate synthase large subunit [Bacteroidota bacterium]
MKASDLFIEALENEGVEYIFGIPGEENLDFLDSLRNSNIQLILTRHEQGAGFMAATYGRLTGKPGVCLATLGPGATNLVTPAAYAQLGAMPMVMITGQKPIKKSKQGQFQIVNIVNLMRPITKYTTQIVNANNIPANIREAFRLAEEERPGVSHLELPEDIASENAEHDIFKVRSNRRSAADIQAVQKAAEMIQNAKRPLLLIAAGANRKRAGKALTEFIDKTKIYFFDTQMGKGVVDECHSQFLGTAALSDNDYLHCAIERADLIINVGHDVVEKPPFFMHNDEKKVIHINFSAAQIDEVYFPQLDVVGDIAGTIEQLTESVKNSPDWDFDYYRRLKVEIDKHLKEGSEDAKVPILPQYLVATVRKTMPADGIVTLDNGVYKIWFARNYHCREANTLLLDNALATMGAGLPSAIAAKLINPDKKVISISGDGGFMMNSQELETAVRLELDLVVIVLNDNAYGMIKWKQEGLGFEVHSLDFGNPDFVKHAESYGAFGHRIKEKGELETVLTKCLNMKGVHLIDVPVEYGENYKVLHEELAAKTCLI